MINTCKLKNNSISKTVELIDTHFKSTSNSSGVMTPLLSRSMRLISVKNLTESKVL